MSVQHEDTLDYKRHKTEEGVKAEDNEKHRPLEKDGLKPRPETIQRLKALHHILPTKTTITPEDPKFTSPTRWVGLDEHNKFVFLYRKPIIAELKYNYVMEKNPYYVEQPLKKTRLPLPNHSVHNRLIVEHNLEYETPIVKRVVVSQPTPILSATTDNSTSIDLFQSVGDKPILKGRRLGVETWSKEDAVLTAIASNKAYSANPTMTGYTVSTIENTDKDFKIVVFKNSSNTILAVRGTNGATNWKTNTTIGFKKYSDYSAHSGYSEVLEIPAINTAIKNVLTSAGNRVLLTGHSAGGGYSLLIRMMFANVISDCRVYTYGQPAVFDALGASTYNSRYLNETFRVYNPYDYVPYTPPYPFHHAGCDVIVKQNLFMIDANGFNEALVSIQALFDAFITPLYIGAVKNYSATKAQINKATSNMISNQSAGDSVVFDIIPYTRKDKFPKVRMRPVVAQSKEISRLIHSVNQYKLDTANEAAQAYIRSIGKQIRSYPLRSGKVYYANLTLTQAEEFEIRMIKDDVMLRLSNYDNLPDDIKAQVSKATELKGKLNIPDKVYDAIVSISQILPYGIAGVSMFAFIAKEHSMDAYEQYMLSLPASQSSVWTNIFDTIRSAVGLVYSYVSAFKGGLPVLFGGGSYIPYTGGTIRDPNTDPILKKMSEDIWKFKTNKDIEEQNKALDEMREIIPINPATDDCPPISREDIVGLVNFTPTNPDNCGIQGLISVP